MNGEQREAAAAAESVNFIRQIVLADLASAKVGRVVTRFPPEPNGYLHIGHAKSIVLNFGLAKEHLALGSACHLRFDDTNPEKEDLEYVESIKRDVKWLGYDWGENLFFASDYYEKLFDYAVGLIKAGHAYVCSLSEEDIRVYRGTVKEPGLKSPYRDRSVEESLDLFWRMRKGEFPEGAHVLRAKIDMAASNMKMRDPLLYRIKKAAHFRQGTAWSVYPMYDFAHCLSDAIEGITHSICTLEFENNRELYDWILAAVDTPARPQQIEFARLNLSYTIMSKRKLLALVRDGHVTGWDDPRMPTIAGMRRRGYTPEAIRAFCDQIGVAKANSTVDVSQLEFAIRDDLNPKAPRVMCVQEPLKVVITNFEADRIETLQAPYFPDNQDKTGMREVPFTREIYIERSDFMENPPKKYFRLAPGSEVRLRWAFVVSCTNVIKNDAGEVVEVHCTYDPQSRGGNPADGRKIKGTIHWVSATQSIPVEVRLYDRLFNTERPDLIKDDDAFYRAINPDSLKVLQARAEPSLKDAAPGSFFQFERQGYYCVDSQDSRPGAPIFNRTVALRDSWAKIVKQEGA